MKTVEEHVTPDGRLRLLVTEHADGDFSIGFDGFPWHTHVDILPNVAGVAATDVLRRYIDDLLTDKLVIAMWGVPGQLRDVWISTDTIHDAAYPRDGEVIEVRYWSGRPYVLA